MKSVLTWIARLVLAGVFGYAAVLKLQDPAAFALDIGHYRLLPYSATLALAVYLPWLELMAAAGVLLRWRERGAQTVLLVLSLVFVGALLSAQVRGLDISCGCFGNVSRTSLGLAVLRAATLAAIAIGLLVTGHRPPLKSSRA